VVTSTFYFPQVSNQFSGITFFPCERTLQLWDLHRVITENHPNWTIRDVERLYEVRHACHGIRVAIAA
jgi:hypothetical protein